MTCWNDQHSMTIQQGWGAAVDDRFDRLTSTVGNVVEPAGVAVVSFLLFMRA